MDEIKRSGYFVKFTGDRSVGIFDSEWEINGDFYFENYDEEKLFKDKLIEAFEYVSDTPIFVESFEERKEKLYSEDSY